MQKLASDTHGDVPRTMRSRSRRHDGHTRTYHRDGGARRHNRKLSRIVEKLVHANSHVSKNETLMEEEEENDNDDEDEEDDDLTSENSETQDYNPHSPSTITPSKDKATNKLRDDNARRTSITTISDTSSFSSMSTARRSTSLTYSSKIRRSSSGKRNSKPESSDLVGDNNAAAKFDKNKRKHMAKLRQYIGKKLSGGSDSETETNSGNDILEGRHWDLEHIEEEARDYLDSDNSDALTIDSDFGVAVGKNGNVVKNLDPEELERIKNKGTRRKLSGMHANEDQFLDEDDTYLDDEEADSEVSEDYEGEEFIEGDENDYDDDEDDEDDDDDEEEEIDDDAIEGESYESEAFDDEMEESTFSDTDSNSMLDSTSLLSVSYNKSQSYIFGSNGHTVTDYGQLSKKRKKKRGSFADAQSTKHTLPKGGLFNNSMGKIPRISSLGNIKGLTIGKEKKQNLFRKIDLKERDGNVSKQSNLSNMIKSRHKLSHTNPLSYYGFVDLDDVLVVGTKKVKLDIFLPPKTTPTLSALHINSNVAISDCIGYVLLSLTLKTEEYKSVTDLEFYDPNNWRLELVDEDGENYGSFGILDRTRLLSSYNCPQQVALCKIENPEEIARNNRIAPLPSEFKQSLAEFQTRSKTTLVSLSNDVRDQESVDIIISLKSVPHDFTQQDYYRMTIPGHITVGQLMQQFCLISGMDPSRWKFRECSDDGTFTADETTIKPNPFLRGGSTTNFSKPLSKSYFSPVLSDTQLVSKLTTYSLEIVPNSAYSMILSATAQGTNADNNGNHYGALNSMITPPANGLTSLITPSTLDEKLLSMALDPVCGANLDSSNNKPTPPPPRHQVVSSSKSKFETEKANKYLQDIMTGKSTMEMPPNINTIYFKWKVWRKKPTILNRIEKSLIIDGDYVHLAPTDDITFRDTNNTFSNSSGGYHSNNNSNSTTTTSTTHHHHHLYYYNYNNYYKELMLKTSSFHITQITKVKHYKNAKNPNQFKIVVSKLIEGGKESLVKKKYDLEASNSKECQEIIEKLKWVMQVYRLSTAN
ncbi:uncharacterized protein KQ657_004285 [Scheffersomyces spartinae]|uniref:Uncharacterized protein n=1 Tax=Scheffersomyces spartinae TaxID=45513 RepID=A0A9P8AJ88_9ASCO|nr:uncharacterized protein KQ657_004285 [Scheffersomyces spartinae]KAG7194609.1 hypothetical protein KQ657_004285 [Scheffersomyces spartinae]